MTLSDPDSTLFRDLINSVLSLADQLRGTNDTESAARKLNALAHRATVAQARIKQMDEDMRAKALAKLETAS